MKTRSLTTAAACASLALAALFFSSAMPGNRIFFAAAAGFFTAPTLIEAGWKWAMLQFFCVFFLGLFILPIKSTSLLYLVLFGWYAIAKYAAENMFPNHTLALCSKLAIFNLSLAVCFFAFRSILPPNIFPQPWTILVIALLQPVFLVYDYALSACITIYLKRIHPLLLR